MNPSGLRALLFDLDGTLVDSAPDLAAATDVLMAELGQPPVSAAELRPHAGSGARGMLGVSLGLQPGDARYEALKQRLHVHYAAQGGARTRCFPLMREALQLAATRGLRLGIVTNKLRRLAEPNVRDLGLMPPAEVLVAGDCTPHTKPHPAPLLAAVQQLGLTAADCVYIGDDPRDMQAAAAAGMPGWAAAWGYLGVGHPVQAWGAERVLDQPADLLAWLRTDA